MPGFHAGQPPGNKGSALPRRSANGRRDHRCHARRRRRYARPPPSRADRDPLRAGLRIQEARALAEYDLDQRRGALLVRRGKGGRRREVGVDGWGWEEPQPWLELRLQLPVRPLLYSNEPTRGRHWSSAAARADLRGTAASAGIRRRFAPHRLRHAHAVELAREGVPPMVIQRQLGHGNLGITSVYLQAIDNAEIIETVHARREPMVPVRTSRSR
jgi:site-specific recombinase XerD